MSTTMDVTQDSAKAVFMYYLGDRAALENLNGLKGEMDTIRKELGTTTLFPLETTMKIVSLIAEIEELIHGPKGIIASMEEHGRNKTGRYAKLKENFYSIDQVLGNGKDVPTEKRKNLSLQIQNEEQKLRRREKDVIIYSNAWYDQSTDGYLKLFHTDVADLKKAISMDGQYTDAEKAEAFKYLDAYVSDFRRIVELQANVQEKIKFLGVASNRLDGIFISLKKDLDADYQSQLELNLVGLVFAISLLLAIGYYLIRGIMRRIRDLNEFMKEMSEGNGDLTRRLDEAGRDEFVHTARLFNRFVGKLREMVVTIKGNGRQLEEMAMEIHSASELISAASAKQSSDTSSVSAAMEETAAAVISVNDSIEAVRRQANNTMETLDIGTAAQQTAANSIRAFIEQSKQIESMTDAIKSIAFQTNILALNAAVEAARAGDHGKGFAVVASEVRSLAQRSNASAVEIGRVIEAIDASIKVVDASANQVTEILGQVFVNVRGTTTIVSEITEATAEQKQATKFISANIEAIAAMTDKTSRTIESSVQNIRRMKELSTELMALVGEFRT